MKVTNKTIHPKVQALSKAIDDLLSDVMTIEQMNPTDSYILANLRFMKEGCALLEGFVSDIVSRKQIKEPRQEVL